MKQHLAKHFANLDHDNYIHYLGCKELLLRQAFGTLTSQKYTLFQKQKKGSLKEYVNNDFLVEFNVIDRYFKGHGLDKGINQDLLILLQDAQQDHINSILEFYADLKDVSLS